MDSFEEVVADNVYHRAFVLGLTRKVLPGTRLESTCRINGEIRASGTTSEDFAVTFLATAWWLEAVDEGLRVGDPVELSIELLGSLAIQIVD